MAPRTDEQKEKKRVASQASRDKKKLLNETNREKARKSQQKYNEKKLKRQRDEIAMAASTEEEYELVPAPMQSPVRVSRWNQPGHQQGEDEEASERSYERRYTERSHERESEDSQAFYATAQELNATLNNAVTQVNNIMTEVARSRNESSAREKDRRSLLSSNRERTLPLASGDHQ
jgi:hypothetical protein